MEYLVPLKEPLMPLHLFKNRKFVTLSIISAVGTMIFYALNIIYPQQAAAVWGQSITEVGWSTVCTTSKCLALLNLPPL